MIALRNVEILDAGRTKHDIIIDGGIIQGLAVAGIENTHNSILFENALAFPGLINSHEHLEFNCYSQLDGGPYHNYAEWGEGIHRRHAEEIKSIESIPRELRERAGIAKNLLCGVTAVAHHGDGPALADLPITILNKEQWIHSVEHGHLATLLLPGKGPVVIHIAEGTDDKTRRETDALLRMNLWRRKLIGIHGIAMRPEQAAKFAAIVWCPMSNEFLFEQTAPIAEMKNHTTILLGSDSTLTSPWNFWEHLRRARAIGALTDDELIASVTTNAAHIWNIPDRATIAPRMKADIVIVRKKYDDPREAFFAINPEDILLVLREGKVILVDASLQQMLPSLADINTLSPVSVNGTVKFTVGDLSRLATDLHKYVPSIPVPISPRVDLY
ncbi:MAG TPA: amidohydrolase family protein [Candidatus Kapabacteria bacterium]|nr:amidohydrolase family protein [Candidatus Kapabacteria bacterium]